MSVNKPQRYKHGVELTPLVDLGFLLVTFFMMITQFNLPDPVQVTIPTSTSDSKLPDSNTTSILVSKEGIIYLMIEGKRKLKDLALRANAGWNLGLTGVDIETFSNLPGIGVSVSGLKQYLRLSESDRKNMTSSGIPVETGHNELSDWLRYIKESSPNTRVVIKGDRMAPYPVIKKIMDTLRDLDINKFSLITDSEKNE